MSDHPPSFFTHDNLSLLSRDYLVVVMFVRSRSEAFSLALDVVRGAHLFAELDLRPMKVFAAGFLSTAKGARHAMDLIHYVRGWRGTHFYAQGRMIIGEMEPALHLEAVLQCFANSCSARDYRAHCFRLIDDPFRPLSPYRTFDHVAPYFRHHEAASEDGTYVFPCSHMIKWFRAQRDHPASIPNQIQAEGVARMCDVCPRFDPDDFGVTAVKRKTWKI